MKKNSTKIQDKNIKIDSLTVYYKLVGNPKNTPLVFLHGHPMPHVPATTFDYSNVLLELSKHSYVIAPEHIATMRSDPPRGPFDMQDRARHLDKFLQKMGISKFVLTGQSFGGGVALVYTSLFPNKVKQLILIDSVSNDLHWTFFIVNIIRFALYKVLHSLRFTMNRFYFVSDTVPWNREKAKLYINSLNPKHRYINVTYEKIKNPTLIVWGNKDVFLTPIWGAYEMNKKIPNSQLIIVNGGHTILYQEPACVVQKIVDYLHNQDDL